jgi:hypothetical protein
MSIICHHKKGVLVNDLKSGLGHSKVAATKLFRHPRLLILKLVRNAMHFAEHVERGL